MNYHCQQPPRWTNRAKAFLLEVILKQRKGMFMFKNSEGVRFHFAPIGST